MIELKDRKLERIRVSPILINKTTLQKTMETLIVPRFEEFKLENGGSKTALLEDKLS